MAGTIAEHAASRGLEVKVEERLVKVKPNEGFEIKYLAGREGPLKRRVWVKIGEIWQDGTTGFWGASSRVAEHPESNFLDKLQAGVWVVNTWANYEEGVVSNENK